MGRSSDSTGDVSQRAEVGDDEGRSDATLRNRNKEKTSSAASRNSTATLAHLVHGMTELQERVRAAERVHVATIEVMKKEHNTRSRQLLAQIDALRKKCETKDAQLEEQQAQTDRKLALLKQQVDAIHGRKKKRRSRKVVKGKSGDMKDQAAQEIEQLRQQMMALQLQLPSAHARRRRRSTRFVGTRASEDTPINVQESHKAWMRMQDAMLVEMRVQADELNRAIALNNARANSLNKEISDLQLQLKTDNEEAEERKQRMTQQVETSALFDLARESDATKEYFLGVTVNISSVMIAAKSIISGHVATELEQRMRDEFEIAESAGPYARNFASLFKDTAVYIMNNLFPGLGGCFNLAVKGLLCACNKLEKHVRGRDIEPLSKEELIRNAISALKERAKIMVYGCGGGNTNLVETSVEFACIELLKGCAKGLTLESVNDLVEQHTERMLHHLSKRASSMPRQHELTRDLVGACMESEPCLRGTISVVRDRHPPSLPRGRTGVSVEHASNNGSDEEKIRTRDRTPSMEELISDVMLQPRVAQLREDVDDMKLNFNDFGNQVAYMAQRLAGLETVIENKSDPSSPGVESP